MTPPSLFQQTRAPYYIFAPNFKHASAGIRNLHYLCHALNELGFEAYIANATLTSAHLNTPLLTAKIVQKHLADQKIPIAVYPEVTAGNPLNAPVVARWLLNTPGSLGPDEVLDPEDLIFYYLSWCLPDGVQGEQLCIQGVDTRIFNTEGRSAQETRSGFVRYAHKYLQAGFEILPEHESFESLGQEVSLTPEMIAAALRKAEALYCYERSTIIMEAIACGCPVICIKSAYWDIQAMETTISGIEIDTGPEALVKAKAEIGNGVSILQAYQQDAWDQIHRFIEITQSQAEQKKLHWKETGSASSFWQLHAKNSPHAIAAFMQTLAASTLREVEKLGKDTPIEPETSWGRWLVNRNTQISNILPRIESCSGLESAIAFQFIVRVAEHELTGLADTLDSLIQQIGSWHLDVISECTAPEGLGDIPCISWHQISEPAQAKQQIDLLVTQREMDLVVELPPGAILDPMYLWRMAHECESNPEKSAFFSDDLLLDDIGLCEKIRFKPGVNVEHLKSSDLAGPLCIRQKQWMASGGAAPSAGSPWFPLLLEVLERLGKDALKHIPDVLINYKGHFPSDPSTCLQALYASLTRQSGSAEIMAATAQSWRIRYPLARESLVTVAVLSQNQADLLIRCLDSILDKTAYPNFEILILADQDTLDCMLPAINERGHCIRTIPTHAEKTFPEKCNLAIENTHAEFLVFLQEDTVVIQPQWLEELLRTVQQPDVAAASPRQIAAGSSLLRYAGSVFGLQGNVGTPYQEKANLEDHGYLDALQIARDISILSEKCALVRVDRYRAIGGMEPSLADAQLATADLSLKYLQNRQRLIYQPLSTIVDSDTPPLDIKAETQMHLEGKIKRAHVNDAFSKSWLSRCFADPYWNPNLSLNKLEPQAEADYQALWQYVPQNTPRILSRPITGAQATYRVTSPLNALAQRGLASTCIWPMGSMREFTAPEIARLNPDSIVVQHYLYDHHLEALAAWHTLPQRPFTVYALDDLLTHLDHSNPFRKNFPGNSLTRLKYALARCDRLVVTTDFLAEAHQNFISDIRVIPNRLEQEIWLPLQSKRRISKKPRIGWAGGSAHQVDLLLLKEVIEQTRNEADWIFFGMCPDEIRPLLAEYHPLVNLPDYPQKLASLNLDIAVAPLAQIPFNQAKSNLRLLEYGVLGIPVVCTNIDPYRGSPAYCVENTTSAWVNAIRERIHAPDAREQEGMRLRRWVHENYLLENHLEEWLQAHLA